MKTPPMPQHPPLQSPVENEGGRARVPSEGATSGPESPLAPEPRPVPRAWPDAGNPGSESASPEPLSRAESGVQPGPAWLGDPVAQAEPAAQPEPAAQAGPVTRAESFDQPVLRRPRRASAPPHALPSALHGGAARLLEEEYQRVELVESVVVHASVTHDPLDLAFARGAVAEHTAGAVVVFEGVIRSHDGDHEDVTSLEYTAHPHASEYLTVVAGEIAAVNPGVHIFVQHRIGHLDVGDVALLAVVASAHRREAFATCADLVDRVKERVPIWKQQHFASGSHEWVGL